MKRTKAKSNKPAKQSKSKGMERHVFNDSELTPRATLVGLRAARAGRFLIGTPDDELALHHYYEKPRGPGYVGTPFEKPLESIEIPPRQNETPPDYASRRQSVLNSIYGHLQWIVREAFDLSDKEGWSWLAGGESERKEILKVANSRPKRMSRSKKAAKMRGMAGRLMKLAHDVEPFSPRVFSDILRRMSEYLTEGAAWEAKLAKTLSGKTEHLTEEEAKWQAEHKSLKRNPGYPVTEAIQTLMYFIRGETGKRHYLEISDLLRLAGLNQYDIEYLNTLHTRDVTNSAEN